MAVRFSLIVRAAPGINEELVASDSERFAPAKYVARYGWVTYFLDLANRPVDWDEVAELAGLLEGCREADPEFEAAQRAEPERLSPHEAPATRGFGTHQRSDSANPLVSDCHW